MNNIVKKYKKLPTSIKATFWFVIASFLQKGISFITVPIFTRLLTAEQYGQVSIYQSWLSIIIIFATLSLWGGVFNNGMLKFEDDRDKFISSIQGLSTIVTILFFIVYLIFHDFFNSVIGFSTPLILVMFAQLLVIPALNYWMAKQRFDYKYKKLVLITILMSIITPLLGVLAVFSTEDKGIARILSAALVQICVGIIFYIFNMAKGKVFFHKKYWKFALGFNLPLVPHYLSGIILNQSDKIMIDKFSGTDKAGIYSLAYSVAMLLTILITSINNSFIPWTYKRIKERKYSDVGDISKFILLIIGVTILFLVALAPEVVKILAPDEYSEAIWVIPPIAVSVYFIFLYTLFANIEFYFEETNFIMIASIIGAALNIILNFLFIPVFGYFAAGFTTLFCYIIFSFAHYYFMKKVCKKYINGESIYNIRFIILLSSGLILSSMLLMIIYNYAIIRYLLICFTGIVLIILRKSIYKKIKIIRKT